MDDVKITGPIEVLALARLAGQRDGLRRYDVTQLRLGRDAEGCYAVCTDTKIMGIARWEPDAESPPPGTDFGVSASAARLMFDVATDEFTNAICSPVFFAGPKWISATIKIGEDHIIDAKLASSPLDAFPPWRDHELMMRWEKEPPKQPSVKNKNKGDDLLVNPSMLSKVLSAFDPISSRYDGVGCLQRYLKNKSGDGVWTFEVSSTSDEATGGNYGDPLPNNLRMWALLMPLTSVLKKYEPMPQPQS